MQTPQLYHYLDRDGEEIDFLFVTDQRFHPIEVKLGTTPKREWAKPFGGLQKFKMSVGGLLLPGAVSHNLKHNRCSSRI
tara:strand:- start:408 stop:644 length:237 start_codon:yes stop_codon:yes gene_type:complete